MATNPLVEQSIDRDLPALIELALKKHNIPVSDRFWMYSSSTGQSQIVVISRLVDQIGTREAYRKVFEALDRETFSDKSYLASNILLLGDLESREILEHIRSGNFRLASLGPFEEVDVYTVPSAAHILKQGLLHITPFGTVAFGYRSSPMKERRVSLTELEELLAVLSVPDSERSLAIEAARNHRPAFAHAQATLETLYEEGLI
jgi:hypothetical protein